MANKLSSTTRETLQVIGGTLLLFGIVAIIVIVA